MLQILLEIQLTGTNLFTHTTNTWYPRFYEVVHTWNQSNSGVAVVVKYYNTLGNILGFIKIRYSSHFLLTYPSLYNATFVRANWPKIWFSIAFVLALCNSFGVKQCQKWLVLQSQKLVKVVFHTQQQLLILWSDILTMKCTPANIIGHLLAKSSMKITFHGSRKDISPLWVGFFLQSIGILWLLYQVLDVIKWFLSLNIWNGRAVPSRLGHVQKASICTPTPVKSREINFFSVFQLWHL